MPAQRGTATDAVAFIPISGRAGGWSLSSRIEAENLYGGSAAVYSRATIT
jgi:hypothetical protein